MAVYGLEMPMFNSWTSTEKIVGIVHAAFDITRKLLEAPMPDAEKSRSVPNLQFPQLASVLFACFQERLDWLGRSVCSAAQYVSTTEISLVL